MSSSYGSEKSSSSSSMSESSSSSSDSSGSSYSSFSSDSSSSDSSSSESNPFSILRLVIYSYVGIDDEELPEQLAWKYTTFYDGILGTNVPPWPSWMELIFDGRLEVGDSHRTIIVDVDLAGCYAANGDFEGEDFAEILFYADWLPREDISSSGNIFLNAIYREATKTEEIFVAGLLPTRDDSATTHKATIRVFPDGFFTIIIPD